MIDPVSLLYSDENIPSYPDVIDGVNNLNAYNITYERMSLYSGGTVEADPYTMILPSIVGTILSVQPGDEMKIMVGSSNKETGRGIVRANVNTMPGFYFTDYYSVYYAST